MPGPRSVSDYAGAAENLPISYHAALAADTPVGVAGTYVSAAHVDVPAGTYEVSASAYFLNGAGAAFVNSKIDVLYGGVHYAYAPTEASCIAAGAQQCYCPVIVIHVPSAATFAFHITSTTATGSLKAATTNGGAVTGASWINASRVR